MAPGKSAKKDPKEAGSRRAPRGGLGAARERERWLLTCLSLAGVGAWDWDVPSGRVFYAIPFAEGGDGTSPYLVADAGDWFATVHPEDAAVQDEQVARALRGETDRFSTLYRRKFALGWRFLRAEGRVTGRGANGRATRVVGTWRDVSELLGRDSELVTRGESVHDSVLASALAELSSGLSHELSQPLAALGATLHAVVSALDAGRPLAESQEALRRSLALSHTAAEILKRMRSHVRRPPLVVESFDAHEVVRDVAVLFSGYAEERSAALSPRPGKAPLVVAGDRIRVGQALANLVRNALEACEGQEPGRRRVTVSATRAGRFARLRVSDTGPGIPPEAKDRVGVPFFTTKPRGTGLGLQLCRSVAEAHGGRLSWTSRAGAGATFTLEIPLASPAGA